MCDGSQYSRSGSNKSDQLEGLQLGGKISPRKNISKPETNAKVGAMYRLPWTGSWMCQGPRSSNLVSIESQCVDFRQMPREESPRLGSRKMSQDLHHTAFCCSSILIVLQATDSRTDSDTFYVTPNCVFPRFLLTHGWVNLPRIPFLLCLIRSSKENIWSRNWIKPLQSPANGCDREACKWLTQLTRCQIRERCLRALWTFFVNNCRHILHDLLKTLPKAQQTQAIALSP